MNNTDQIKRFTAVTLLAAMTSPAAFAHSGHGVDPSLHSLLHSEHVIVLAVAAVLSLAAYARRNK